MIRSSKASSPYTKFKVSLGYLRRGSRTKRIPPCGRTLGLARVRPYVQSLLLQKKGGMGVKDGKARIQCLANQLELCPR